MLKFAFLTLGFVVLESFVIEDINAITESQKTSCIKCIKQKCDKGELTLRYQGVLKNVADQLCEDSSGQLVSRICTEWPRHTGDVSNSVGYEDLAPTKGRSTKNILETYRTEDAQFTGSVPWSEHFHNKYARQCFSQS